MRVARILHWGTEAERRRHENRGADGAEEVGLSRGCSLPNRLGGLGSVGSPGRQQTFGIFEAYRTLLVERTVLL